MHTDKQTNAVTDDKVNLLGRVPSGQPRDGLAVGPCTQGPPINGLPIPLTLQARWHKKVSALVNDLELKLLMWNLGMGICQKSYPGGAADDK